MADTAQSKIDAAAQKAYAEAAGRKIDEKKVEKAVEAGSTPEPKVDVIAEAVEAPVEANAKKVSATKPKSSAKKAAPRKAAATKAAAKKRPAAKSTTSKPATKKTAAKAATPISKAKDTIMATAKNAKTTDFTDTAKTMAADAQTRLKGAYEKGSEVAGDVVAFHKHNFEAVVESGKVWTSGMQDMGREALADTKKAAEQVTEDVRLMAAVKSPTELMKLQGDIARRNMDAAIAYGSKSTEAWLKLANEAIAPLTSRASEAAEKFTKAA